MAIGSIALGTIAWLLVAGAFALRTSHELSAVALMIAVSGAAVAREGRRVEVGASPGLLSGAMLLNLAACAGAVLSIVVEIVRRRAG